MKMKYALVSSVFLLSSVPLWIAGCASYTDLKPGTVKEITRQEAFSSPVVEQELVTVPTFTESPPPADYIVGPNDVLFINVNGDPQFSSAFGSMIGGYSPGGGSGGGGQRSIQGNRVDGSGNIQFPFGGTVHVAGLTLAQIQTELVDILKKYIKEPWVIVEMVDYKSQPIYLMGQFKNSGTFYMDRPINVLQGIALGSGYDPTADLSGARVIRDNKVIPVDVQDLLTRGDQKQNIWLKPGDAIFIPDNKNQMVFVFGAVKKGGPVPIPPTGLTLAQAVATAEIRDTGYNIHHVRIIRSLSPTRGQLIVVDFDRVLRGEALPFPLKAGDIVFVPKSRLGNWNDAMNEMLPTLQAFSALLQPFVSIKYLGGY